MSTTAEKIEIMQWHEDGKQVECRNEFGAEWAEVSSHPRWNWGDYDYRKKPEPIECWVTVLDGRVTSTVHMTEDAAIRCLEGSPKMSSRWSVRKAVIE